MKIVQIGATGLIGRQLWPLLEQGHDVLVLGRRPSGARWEKLAPMEEWPALLADEQVEVAVSTLGTTWEKSGSWERFEAVDHHAVVAFARAAHQAGARQFLFVSSVGADSASRNRYLSLKGVVERDLEEIGFERLDVIQPGLLVGERQGDRRVLERLGIKLSALTNHLLPASLDRYRAIDSALVARAMAQLIGESGPGIFIHRNREICALAAQ